jgi:hypothetical protein
MRVFGQQFFSVWGLTLPAAVPVLLLAALSVLGETTSNSALVFVGALAAVASAVTPFCLQCSVAVHVRESLAGKAPSYLAALTAGLDRFTTLLFTGLGISLLLSIVTPFAIGYHYLVSRSWEVTVAVTILPALLVLPVISRLSMALPACGAERLTGWYSLVRAWRLSKSNFVPVTVIFLLVICMAGSFAYLAQIIVRNSQYRHLLFVIVTLASTLPLAFIATLQSVTYCQLKISEESQNFMEESTIFDQIQP